MNIEKLQNLVQNVMLWKTVAKESNIISVHSHGANTDYTNQTDVKIGNINNFCTTIMQKMNYWPEKPLFCSKNKIVLLNVKKLPHPNKDPLPDLYLLSKHFFNMRQFNILFILLWSNILILLYLYNLKMNEWLKISTQIVYKILL